MCDEQLHSYARRTAYVYIPSQFRDAVIHSETQANDICEDLLTIHVVKDTHSDAYKVLHCGSYCALVHLSCELLCEIISQSPCTQWSVILENIAKPNENTKTEMLQGIQRESQEMFFQLQAKTLSKQRRACLMLPCKILITLTHTMNKKYNERGAYV